MRAHNVPAVSHGSGQMANALHKARLLVMMALEFWGGSTHGKVCPVLGISIVFTKMNPGDVIQSAPWRCHPKCTLEMSSKVHGTHLGP
jgi:hypothetical protein